MPLLASDMTGTALFPTVKSNFFSYNNGYNQNAVLENGKGYWAKFEGLQNATITGTFINSNEIPVTQNWNLIGPFAFEVPVNNITTFPDSIISSQFFGYNSKYHSTDTLKSGKGYWVKANSNGVLQLKSK